MMRLGSEQPLVTAWVLSLPTQSPCGFVGVGSALSQHRHEQHLRITWGSHPKMGMNLGAEVCRCQLAP